MVVSVDSSILSKACSDLRYVSESGFREAEGDEIDYLARKYLNIMKSLNNEE